MKFHVLPFLFLLLFCCSGCSATQVRDRLYLQSMELSKSRHPTVQLHAFASDSAEHSGSGETVSDALEIAEISAGKELFLGHLELLCLQDTAFLQQLPTFLQSYRFSSGCKVLYSPRSLESSNTELLLEQLRQEEENGRLPETDLLTVLKERNNTSETVLLPMRLTNGFSMVLVQNDGTLQTLSDSAIQGLCWLRGDNLPERVSLSEEASSEDFFIDQADVQLTTAIEDGIPIVTVSISVQGTGNTNALQAALQTACEAAEKETIQQYQADVIGLEACLRQQCYDRYMEQDWHSLLRSVQFQHKFTLTG